jgi:hypothetical protein
MKATRTLWRDASSSETTATYNYGWRVAKQLCGRDQTLARLLRTEPWRAGGGGSAGKLHPWELIRPRIGSGGTATTSVSRSSLDLITGKPPPIKRPRHLSRPYLMIIYIWMFTGDPGGCHGNRKINKGPSMINVPRAFYYMLYTNNALRRCNKFLSSWLSTSSLFRGECM